MQKYFILICVLSLVSCATYQNTTHSFSYHGTDNLGLDQGFFYVKYGVKGMSSTSYAMRTLYGDFLGGDVRSGLVADAKADLIIQHPLEPNQTYANLSVDIMRTEKGDIMGSTLDLKNITISAVITADIIQYGQVPQNYEVPIKRSQGTIAGINDDETTNVETSQTNSAYEASVGNTSGFKFSIGDKVDHNFKGRIRQGEIVKRSMNYGFPYYIIEFDIDGKFKTRTVDEARVIEMQK
jgi:hypothetical protein